MRRDCGKHFMPPGPVVVMPKSIGPQKVSMPLRRSRMMPLVLKFRLLHGDAIFNCQVSEPTLMFRVLSSGALVAPIWCRAKYWRGAAGSCARAGRASVVAASRVAQVSWIVMVFPPGTKNALRGHQLAPISQHAQTALVERSDRRRLPIVLRGVSLEGLRYG